MHIYWFLLGLLAVWRVSHLLALEDGPWQMVVRIRRSAGNGFWGGLLDCFNCLSLWASVPFALGIGAGSGERVCLWLALSGGAITLQQLTSPAPPMPVFHEHGDPDHVMLRQSENTDPTEPPDSIGH